MSCFLENLRAERTTPVAVFHEFRLGYAANPSVFHAFVEGRGDKEYYSPAITDKSGFFDVKFYICNGRPGVLEALRSFRTEYPGNDGVMFFVDRDYGEYVGDSAPNDPALYVSDNYSIESDIATSDCLSYILKNLVHADYDEDMVAALVHQYELVQTAFATRLRRFSALCIAERRLKSVVNLNNVSVSKSFELDGNLSLVDKDPFDYALNTSAAIPTGAIDSVTQIDTEAELDDSTFRSWVRGKFLMWLFITYVNKIWAAMAAKKGPQKRRHKQIVFLTEDNVFCLTAGRIPYPQSLLNYLNAQMF